MPPKLRRQIGLLAPEATCQQGGDGQPSVVEDEQAAL
eukprot:CAMPEP_0177213588 /NCGR_PEP_ID=MMETSP0367-20130122/33244_1 /TAXON_ID=447022 ORGANISM="Scrippsiella hangoei-like, Strain SHHI-4" /NCGR_SAMPLE_ID=MMETSP0367 /ASSEMBLY_ACC=CAM_ASM_000362 /LENGTH=36 /DNA_ID= /DNA_START= /DNA_END= /DNA_ORIENTATION=